MPILTAPFANQRPLLLPWERATVDDAPPGSIHLNRGTTVQRIGFIVSGIVVFASVIVMIVAFTLLDGGSQDSVAAVSIMTLSVVGVYLVYVAQVFVQPSVVVLGEDELVAKSLLGTQRRELAAMTGLHRTEVKHRVHGITSPVKTVVNRMLFDEGRNVTLRGPARDWDVREFLPQVRERWTTIRRAAVHRRLATGETVVIPRAFAHSDRSGTSFYGSVSTGPSGISIEENRRNSIDIAWDRIAQVQLSDDGLLSIDRVGAEAPVTVEGLVAPGMLAANIADRLSSAR